MDKNMKKMAVLGASDPEMQEIERVALELGLKVAHATLEGRRVVAATAYKATGATQPLEGEIVAVECGGPVFVDHKVVNIDHHRPGDPGFGVGPEGFLAASSLGQFLAFVGREPTETQRLICAADHCLGAAYKGLCPGVDPRALRDWRTRSRAEFSRRTTAEQNRLVDEALSALQQLPTVEVGDCKFRDARAAVIQELPEAAAITGTPVLYAMPSPQGLKVGVLNGTPDEIRAFLDNAAAMGLVEPYGDPERGFAGAYQR